MRYLLVLLLFISSSLVFAQQEDTTGFVGFKVPAKKLSKSATAIFKVGIFPFFEGQVPGTGELRFNYERVIAAKQSIVAGLSYDFPNLIGLAVSAAGIGGGRHGGGGGGRHGGYGGGLSILGGNNTDEGVRGMLGYRYYPFKKQNAPAGFYVGPYVSYNFVDVRDKAATQYFEELNYFDACGVVGYQIIKKNHFVFDVTGGLGYKDNFITHPDSNVNAGTEAFGNLTALNHVKFMLQMNFGYAF